MDIFYFKQFSVAQSGCVMKINTDGVLLGALANKIDPVNILDIGTGTGVIALMLAQRFPMADIDAVDINETTANTARRNFKESAFRERLNIFSLDFKEFFQHYPQKRYDLIVSNPPFHLHALKPASEAKILARHTDETFYNDLIKYVSCHLTETGVCQLILPLQAASLVKALINNYDLYLQSIITIRSFDYTNAHREILAFGRNNSKLTSNDVVIYSEPKVYSETYRQLLRDFLTIF